MIIVLHVRHIYKFYPEIYAYARKILLQLVSLSYPEPNLEMQNVHNGTTCKVIYTHQYSSMKTPQVYHGRTTLSETKKGSNLKLWIPYPLGVSDLSFALIWHAWYPFCIAKNSSAEAVDLTGSVDIGCYQIAGMQVLDDCYSKIAFRTWNLANIVMVHDDLRARDERFETLIMNTHEGKGRSCIMFF